MSARNGLREHFVATVQWSKDGVSNIGEISAFELTTADASRVLRARAKRDGMRFVTGTTTNLTNGRTLKIVGLRPSEVATI